MGGSDETYLLKFIATWKAQGHILTQIAATGSLGNTLWWKRSLSTRMSVGICPLAPRRPAGLSNGTTPKRERTLCSFTIYGSGTSRYYAAVWHGDPAHSRFHIHTPDETTPPYNCVRRRDQSSKVSALSYLCHIRQRVGFRIHRQLYWRQRSA